MRKKIFIFRLYISQIQTIFQCIIKVIRKRSATELHYLADFKKPFNALKLYGPKNGHLHHLVLAAFGALGGSGTGELTVAGTGTVGDWPPLPFELIPQSSCVQSLFTWAPNRQIFRCKSRQMGQTTLFAISVVVLLRNWMSVNAFFIIILNSELTDLNRKQADAQRSPQKSWNLWVIQFNY